LSKKITDPTQLILERLKRVEDSFYGDEGVLSRLKAIETDINWIKNKLNTIDHRVWGTLASVIVLGIIAILVALFG